MSRKQKSHGFYEYYPKLFHLFYQNIETQTIEELSKAGFAYYQSVINLDAIIDKGELHRIFYVLDLQEEAIKKLSKIFPENPLFWQLWQQRKAEYKEVVSLEKQLFEDFSEEKYFEVADKKSAFGKVAIDSLHVLSETKDEELYHNLLESHKYFSLGFQIYDDINDFREDFHAKQFNIALKKQK